MAAYGTEPLREKVFARLPKLLKKDEIMRCDVIYFSVFNGFFTLTAGNVYNFFTVFYE